jgi:hypothetical protein
MPIDSLGYSRYLPNHYDFSSEIKVDFDSNKSIQEKQQKKYYSDTVAPFILSAYAPYLQMVKINPDSLNSRPRLEGPELGEKEIQSFFSNINHHLIHEVEKKEELSHTYKKLNVGESFLLSLLLKCYQEQKNRTEEENLIVFETIKKKQATNQKLSQEYFSHLDEMVSRSQTSEKLAWVSWILSGGVILSGLASLALTWGSSAPAVITSWLTLGNAIGGISAGSVKIAQGVYDYNSNTLLGEIKELEFERQHSNEKIHISMEEMKRSIEVVADIMQQMSEILNNVHQAFSNMRG